MAEKSRGDHSRVRVWTFDIYGGEEISMSLPNNPSLEHFGGCTRTVWKLLGTESLALSAQNILLHSVESVTLHMEDESEEQKKIREARVSPPAAD